MSDLERDEVVARALRELPVPEHRPTFWAELEAAVSATSPVEAGSRPATAIDEGVERLATGELPAVASLADRRASRRTPILVAAAAVLLVVAAGLVTLGGGGDDDGGTSTELADQPEGTTADERSAEVDPSRSTLSPSPGDTALPETLPATTLATAREGTPEAVVAEWLDDLGGADPASAAALTGPRTTAYVESQGADATIEGFLRESAEGFGAWADVADREVSVLPIGPLEFDGGTLQVVVVSGTYPGEGGDGRADAVRIDVFPVVDDGDGFKVEHLAFDPTRDNDPVFTVPAETADGLGEVDPTVEINVFVPAPGSVYFQIDGGDVVADTTSEVAGDDFALFDPPGELTPGAHQLVLVAVGDDGTLSQFSGSFVVAA